MRRSITRRVALSSGGVAFILAVLAAAAVSAWAVNDRENASVRLAEAQASQIAALTSSAVQLGGDFGPYPYQLLRSDGVVVSGSFDSGTTAPARAIAPFPQPTDESLIGVRTLVRIPDDVPPPLGGTTCIAISDTLMTVDADPSALPGGPANGPVTYRVYVFVPDASRAVLPALLPVLVLAVTVAALVVAGVAAGAARIALRPVELMRVAAASLEPTFLPSNVSLPGADISELSALADTLERLISGLAEADRSRTRFVADAAHELRSPLAAMTANLEVARLHPQAMHPEEALDESLKAVRELQALADDLLTLASAKSADPHAVSDVAAIALDVAHDFPAVEVRVLDHPLPAAIDPSSCRRIIRNLLDNARRHSRHESGVIIDETVGSAEDMSMVRIRVWNDGDPIPERALAYLFEPFWRADGERGRETGGTGLGLAIVRELVTARGGSISASGGSPTEFTVLVPGRPPSSFRSSGSPGSSEA